MALFKRPALKEQGFSEAQIDWLMTEAQRSLGANYIPKTDVQDQIDAAVQAALKDAPQAVDPTTTDAYKAVAEERDMLRALGGEEFASVKPKFRESVYKQLDRGEGAPSVADQLNGIREKYEEYFESDPTPAKPDKSAPHFGAPVTGSMPASGPKSTLENIWFGPK